jgi:hypothetical protein
MRSAAAVPWKGSKVTNQDAMSLASEMFPRAITWTIADEQHYEGVHPVETKPPATRVASVPGE